MDMSVFVNFAQAAQAAMQHDPFGWLVVYPAALFTGGFMLWAGMQSNTVAECA